MSGIVLRYAGRVVFLITVPIAHLDNGVVL